MAGVLGIDAAWTEKEPAGVALLEGRSEVWRCVAVAPSYDSFLALAEGIHGAPLPRTVLVRCGDTTHLLLCPCHNISGWNRSLPFCGCGE